MQAVENILLFVGSIVLILVIYLVYRWVVKNRVWLTERLEAFLKRPLVHRTRVRFDRQLSWPFRRLTPGQYLGLHLTLGLLAAAGCLWLFGGLAEDLVTSDPLVRFDEMVARTLHDAATPAVTNVFLGITALGSIETVALFSLLLAGLFAMYRRWLHVWSWFLAIGGGVALNVLLKQLFERPRPSFVDPLLVETSYSFPSGHAMVSLVLYGMMAYFTVLALKSWRTRTAVIFGAALLVLLIGFSRIYLGVQYFSDVVAGFAAGGVWLSACITGMETIRRRSKGRPNVLK